MASYVPGIFADINTAYAAAQKMAASQGIALRKKKTTQSRALFECNKGGVYKQHQSVDGTPLHKRRKTTTQKTGCTWKVWAVNRDGDGWIFEASKNEHNHTPGEAVTHAWHRSAFVRANKKQILGLYDDGLPVRKIMRHLHRQFDGPEGAPVTSKDVYNLIATHEAAKQQQEFEKQRPQASEARQAEQPQQPQQTQQPQETQETQQA